MFSQFQKDRIKIIKKNGEIYNDIPAGVQTNTIFMNDVSIPIEIGDTICRSLPSGIEERFLVTNPGYSAGLASIKPHYQIKYKREDAIHESENSPNTVIYNVSGPNSRVNIHSQDYSTNHMNSAPNEIFDGIRTIITKEIKEETERRVLMELANKMQSEHGSPSFINTYKDFMSTAANHIGVFSPLLPALAGLLA